ncbi:hypothetical protein Z517_09323 [Fonsecaea pedrosoi CBS 271.37]|uniref:Uncharacterized protein n=1 Tax=Fonsecaea pedrosoi CBS 271.37 TaxID=1442368 RepID=A0A0D2GX01_9EURO|nr:uncharacterized protein Z517_09323 [Fonsecaea pedrosoi CBS 271.37]KIW76879.1 hypothetical protein Z517_09323 [Fonsecaea pedrosoi CBS 271.37]
MKTEAALLRRVAELEQIVQANGDTVKEKEKEKGEIIEEENRSISEIWSSPDIIVVVIALAARMLLTSVIFNNAATFPGDLMGRVTQNPSDELVLLIRSRTRDVHLLQLSTSFTKTLIGVRFPRDTVVQNEPVESAVKLHVSQHPLDEFKVSHVSRPRYDSIWVIGLELAEHISLAPRQDEEVLIAGGQESLAMANQSSISYNFSAL